MHSSLSSFIQENPEIFTQITEALQEVFWLIDPVSEKIIYISNSYEKIFEKPCTTLYEDPHSWLSAVHDEDKEMVLRYTAQVHNKLNIEYRILTPSGMKWIRARTFPVHNEKGEVVRVAGIAQDITEQKNSSEAILSQNVELEAKVKERSAELESTITKLLSEIMERKAAEDKIRYQASLIENLSDAVIATDLDFTITRWNPGAEKIYEWKEAEALGKNSKTLMRTHFTQGDWEQVIQSLNNNGVWKGEVIERCKQQNLHYIFSSISFIKDSEGSNIGMIRINRDITESKVSAMALRKSESLYKTLVEMMNDGVTLVDNNHVLLFANRRFYEMMGYTKEEIIGKNMVDVFLMPEDYGLMNNVLQTRQRGLGGSYEIKMKKRSGEYVPVLVSGAPMKDEEGRIIGSIGVHTDISGLKRIEQELKNKISELNTFVYRASHDLRAPMISLLGLINVAREEINDRKSDIFFPLIDESTRKMDRILLDLASIARISHDTIGLSEVNIEQLVHDILKSLGNIPGFSEIHFEIESRQKQPLVTDERSLRSVLQNLIDNSIKYRNSRNRPPRTKILIREEADNCIIEVSDNGIGISTELKNRVFDMFFRATEYSSGSGLGLYIVKSAVEKLGGKIELKSEEMAGSTFTISLPRSWMADSNRRYSVTE